MACKKKELIGFKHEGFWQCMDTIRDKEILEENIDKYFEKNRILIVGGTDSGF